MEKDLLLVDDEEGIRTVLSLYLSDLGYRVSTARDGEEGLQQFRRSQPEIVITDIKMPVMDGIALLKRIKAENPDTEVIVLTGHGDLELAIACLKLEAVDFVTKPIDDDVLEIALKRARDKIEMRRQLSAYTENLERLVEEKSARLVAAERKEAVNQALEGFSTAMQNMTVDLAAGLGYFNDLPCFVSIHAPDGTIVAANPKFVSRFGDRTGQPGTAVFAASDTNQKSTPAAATFQTGRGLRESATLTSADGVDTAVMIYTAPIRDAAGQVSLVVQIAADISEIQRLQQELDATQQRYQQLFDEAPCYITVQDSQLRITAANRRFKEDFGPVPQPHCFQIYQQRQAPCADCPVRATFSDGQPHQREMDVRPARDGDGAFRRMLVWTSPLRDSRGRITHVMEMSTDVTQIRRLQDQLAHLGSVVGSLSHEIKGLLTGLDGGVYLLDSGFEKEDTPKVKEGWNVVRLMTGRIRSLVTELLAYAKGRDIPWEKMDGLSFVRELEIICRPKMERAGISMICRFDPELRHLLIDVGMARAILTNILDNALEACATEADAAKKYLVQFSASTNADRLLFKIVDNGPGIAAENLSKIFSPHFESTKKGGTGLGLYLARRILISNRGQISVDSTPGQGTCFTIDLPGSDTGPRQDHPLSDPDQTSSDCPDALRPQ